MIFLCRTVQRGSGGGGGGGDEVWDRETMFSKLVKAVTLSGGQRIIAVFFLK